MAVGMQVYPDDNDRAGEQKDPAANIARTGQFVINIIDEPMLPDLVDCPIDFLATDNDHSLP